MKKTKAEGRMKKEETATGTVEVAGAPLQQEAARGDARPTVDSGEFKRVPRGLIRPDPNQPRKEFKDSDLEEMAVSIYLQGIIQPLVVKRVPAELKIIEPDMMNGKMWQAVKVLADGHQGGAVVFESKDEAAVRTFAQGKTEEYYQLIAGERRWRSTEPRTIEVDGQTVKWPGLAELPVMVRAADERATFALQHMENQKRINLSALDEARSFGAELARRQAEDPTMTAEKLGAELGIKKVTAYARLKLLRLSEPVRAALVAGKIETTHALAIAKVPDVKRQEELLVRCKEDADYGEDMLSSRALEELIDDEYVKQLKDAPFDKADDKLVPVSWEIRAGENQIVLECAKRPQILDLRTIGVPKVHPSNALKEHGMLYVTSGDNFDMAGPLLKKDALALVEFLTANAKAGRATVTQASGWACTACPHRSGNLDPETKTPNVCCLPSCFDAKVKAHWVKKAADLKAKGTEVLTEGELRKRGAHISEDKRASTMNRYDETFKELMGKHAPEPVLVATKEGIKKFYPQDEAIQAAKKNGVKFYNNSLAPKTAAEKAKEEEEKKKREAALARRRDLVLGHWKDLVAGISKIKDADAWELVLELMGDPWMEPEPEKALVNTAKTPRAKVLGMLLAKQDNKPLHYNGEWREDALKAWKLLGVDLAVLDKEAEKAAQPALPLKKALAKAKIQAKAA